METQSQATDPTGICFVSYRRSRLAEVGMLINGLRERGIPTWQDVTNLDETHTNSELRRVLKSTNTANAVLWVSPDVASSDIIRRVEAPIIISRADDDDNSFFVVPVAVGGSDYTTAANAVGEDLSLTTLEEWNIRKINNDPAKEADIKMVAQRVLSRRIKAIAANRGNNQPISIGLFARKRPPEIDKFALTLDWTHRISIRHASETIWKRHLIPAVEDVVNRIDKHGGGCGIVASGFPTIAAAFVLGRGFMAPRGINAQWLQFTPTIGEVSWSLQESREQTCVAVKLRDKDAGGSDLAVLVSVSSPVEHAWSATRSDLPNYRAMVDVRSESLGSVLSAGQALDIAHQVVDGIRQAQIEFRPKGETHIFMAAPVGLSFMIGQLSNTLGPIRIFEFDECDATGRYVPGPLITNG